MPAADKAEDACGPRVKQLEAKLATLAATDDLRAAARAKCDDVCKEFRKLFEVQMSTPALLRDQEVGRARNQTAVACAEAPGVGSPANGAAPGIRRKLTPNADGRVD